MLEESSEQVKGSAGSYMENMLNRLVKIRTMSLDDSSVPELTQKQRLRSEAFELCAVKRREEG